jgi:hypothetical protein
VIPNAVAMSRSRIPSHVPNLRPRAAAQAVQPERQWVRAPPPNVAKAVADLRANLDAAVTDAPAERPPITVRANARALAQTGESAEAVFVSSPGLG